MSNITRLLARHFVPRASTLLSSVQSFWQSIQSFGHTYVVSTLASYDKLLIGAYLLVFIALAVYGFTARRWCTCTSAIAIVGPSRWGACPSCPKVTVQLPLFNEMYVARACSTRWRASATPRSLRGAGARRQHRRDAGDLPEEGRRAATTGLDIVYIHRTDRTGFKAGALENGLKTAKGEYVLVFDADFRAEPDVLERTIHFFSDPQGRHGAGALGATSTATTRA